MRPIYLAMVTALLPALLARADAPATEPTPPPYVMIMPQGMQPVVVGEHTVLCLPDMAAAAKAGLGKVTAATRPSTTASDVLQRFDGARATLLHDMPADLGVTPDKVSKFLDETLKPALAEVASVHPKVYIVLCTQEQLAAASRQGWNAPLFHYNPLADHTFYTPRIVVPSGRAMDAVVLWSETHAGESDGDISAGLVETIREFESGFADGLSQDAMLQVRQKTAEFISVNVVNPLKLPDSEQWFGLGLMGAMSSKYAAPLTGLPRAALAASAASDTPANPLKSAPLDLLEPFDSTAVKPQYLPYYLDAISRKAAGIVQKVIDKAGDAAITKLLASLKASIPADNNALVKLISDISGVDVTNDLLPPPAAGPMP